ncbi:MAG: flagellin [Gallionellaceae bacterium]
MINSVNYASSLSTSQSRLTTALQALGSGSSINSVADNAAGLAQSTSFSVQISGAAQSINNAQSGISMLDTASGAVDQINRGLQDIRTLTVQAGNGALNASDRQAIQSQIGQISQGIDQVAANTQFNGQNLLDGSAANSAIQVGGNAGQTQNVQLGSLSNAALGIAGVDVTTAAGQTSALSSLDSAIQQVSSQGGSIAAAQASLSSAQSSQSAAYTSLAAAKSRVSDTDYAQASSQLAQSSLQQQTSLRALALYNSTQNNLLTLLPK